MWRNIAKYYGWLLAAISVMYLMQSLLHVSGDDPRMFWIALCIGISVGVVNYKLLR